MKKLLVPAMAALIFFGCKSPLSQRCDRITIDNPTAEDYFLVVDADTLDLSAYTYISYEPSCSDADGKLLNGTHHYTVLDKSRKAIFDTSITSTDHYLFINPTRSTYVEWKVYYGDETHDDEYTTLVYDSVEYEGVFTEYSSFAFVTKAGGTINCGRSVAETIEVLNEANNYRHYFFRQADFVVAYNGFGAINPKESARVDLYNQLTDLYNYAVEHKDQGYISDLSLKSWYDQISAEQYDQAMNTLHTFSHIFREEPVKKADRYYEMYQNAPELEQEKQTYTELHTVDYAARENGTIYKEYTSDYDPATGECASDYHDQNE